MAQVEPKYNSKSAIAFHGALDCSFSTHNAGLASCSGTDENFDVTVSISKEVHSLTRVFDGRDVETVGGHYTVSMLKHPRQATKDNPDRENTVTQIEYGLNDCGAN